MLKCNDCGTIFNNGSGSCDSYGEIEYSYDDTCCFCPDCGGDDLNPLSPCPVCGAWADNELCADCWEHICDGMSELINDMGIMEDGGERAVLAAMEEWIERR